jgi:hypothetical protein
LFEKQTGYTSWLSQKIGAFSWTWENEQACKKLLVIHDHFLQVFRGSRTRSRTKILTAQVQKETSEVTTDVEPVAARTRHPAKGKAHRIAKQSKGKGGPILPLLVFLNAPLNVLDAPHSWTSCIVTLKC